MKISVSPQANQSQRFALCENGDDVSEDYNIYNRQTYTCPHYFRIYFQVTFHLLLTPFQVVFDGHNYKTQTFMLQKILCVLLHPGICIVALLGIRRDFNVKVRIQPSLLFSLANNFSWCMYAFSYLYTFWTQDVLRIFNIPASPPSFLANFKGIGACVITVVLIILNIVGLTLFGPNLSQKEFLNEYAGQAMFMWFQLSNNTEMPHEMLTTSVQIVSYITFFFDCYLTILIAFMETFAMLSCLAVYESCRNVAPLFLEKKCHNLKVLLQHYCDLKELISRINELNGVLMLWIYVQIIPWISGSLMDFFDDEDWSNRVFMWAYYIMYVILLGMAAETNMKMKKFRKVLLQLQHEVTENRDEIHFVSMYLKATVRQTGITGGKFFMISYGFLGATISVLLTYSIIMIQFKANPSKH